VYERIGPAAGEDHNALEMTTTFKRSRGEPHLDRDGYRAQFVYNGESAVVLNSTVAAGRSAPPQHVHEHCDQLFYVVEGEMHVQLGPDVLVAPPDTLVYIPRGTPHHNWNQGDADEFHFEVLSPAPLVTQPVATPTDSTDAGSRSPFVRRLDEVGLREVLPGFSTARLLQRADGSERMALYLGEVAPNRGGPGTHVHPFDQFYFVLEGELTVEVALHTLTAARHDLVVLPAGVPHRQWNQGSVPERHLTLIVPEPQPGETWDVGVDFAPNGIDH
jgi:mannose-6-phosphate isomerase-like protein (cupin superfamily)